MTEHKNVVVAVRCRPLNTREKQRKAQSLVSVDGAQTILDEADDAQQGERRRKRQRRYTFDYSYWAADKPGAAGQSLVFGDIGESVLEHALAGYHCCVFAYGETASGKTYTMMGTDKEPGLIPRLCTELFCRIDQTSGVYHVEVSYLEIYNERVRDLLDPQGNGESSLRVREHPSLGPYVEDLTKAAVSSGAQMLEHMAQGNRARTVAATGMNAQSSRSHAVFTVVVTRREKEGTSGGRVSRISLVDLAGSERANSTQATGVRLREGARINQSLAVLGKVISALAARTSKKEKRADYVPYRDSVLTWLLKDSLGGNSRTFMIATVSPADYHETLSTLRYADRARRIVNAATVNEDAAANVVTQLRGEIAELRQRLAQSADKRLEEQLVADEKLVAELNRSWEDKLRRTQELAAEREQSLAALGIAVDAHGRGVGLHVPRDAPHLVNLSEDPLMSECLVYSIKPGVTMAGNGSVDDADIKLGGPGTTPVRFCTFDYDPESSELSVRPLDGSLVLVNGQRIDQAKPLRSGYRVIIGGAFIFRLNHPQQARRERALGAGDAPADWHDAWGELSSDNAALVEAAFDPDSAFHGQQVGRYSPTTWSDTVSELSELPESTATNSSPNAPCPRLLCMGDGARPSSQLSFRRGPRMRRGSEAASVIADRRRARGQSTSLVFPAPIRIPAPAAAAAMQRERMFYERRLARMVIEQWRRFKLVRVGQQMLRNAIHIKEANIIGKELGQKVVYQFAILRGGADSLPASPLEPDALPALLSEDWDSLSMEGQARRVKTLDNPVSAATVPEVVVKVLDIAHACWYVWSLPQFLERLSKMRSLSTVKGSYRAHLVLDPFHANPAPRYSCIGAATHPIWPGDRPYSARIDAPVIDGLSGLERARATGSLAALPVRSQHRNRTGASSRRAWNVIVHVKALVGVSELNMTQVHCRLRLVRIPGLLSSTRSDKPLISPILSPQPTADYESQVMVSAVAEQAPRMEHRAISGFGDGPVNLQFRQQWTVDMLTEDTCVVIEFFARLRPAALHRAFHEDVQIEDSLQSCRSPPMPASTPSSGDTPPLSASQNLLVERLHEEELFVDSHHEITAWVRVLELGLDGSWERAPCIRPQSHSPAFLLRQGLQRRIQVVLAHNASQNLRICSVSELCVGAPVLVDDKGRLVSPAPSAIDPQSVVAVLPITDVHLATERPRVDNRCFVTLAAPWDTSVYGSRLLDVPTRRNMRVRLSLSLSVEIENGLEPLVLSTDVFAKVYARQSMAGRGGWISSLTDSATDLFSRAAATISSSPSSVSLMDQVSADNASRISLSTIALDDDGSEDTCFPPVNDPVFRIFSVTLSPVTAATQSKESLWRLNTGKKYVRGEETLLPWKPRSVKAVDEYYRLERIEAWRLIVARTRERVEELGPTLDLPLDEQGISAVRQAIGSSGLELSLVQQRVRQLVLEAVRRFQTFRCVPESRLNLQQEPTVPANRPSESPLGPSLPDGRRISLAMIRQMVRRQIQNVRQITMQGHFCHCGFMDILDTNKSEWVRRWFVVERPYVFVFVDSRCRRLDNVLNIASARISVDPQVSEMVGRENVLALYTNSNAYLLNPPVEEMQQWISAVDEWFFML
ncbi:hypothetical protein GGF46_005028 [Coemansia sp. RSA 552]|nr:hypothetical protein GGF46_005028 [Coemansia sp. RSA 552]